MPSFTFWKASKDEQSQPPQNEKDVEFNLDPGNQDSGVFHFDEEAFEDTSAISVKPENGEPATLPTAQPETEETPEQDTIHEKPATTEGASSPVIEDVPVGSNQDLSENSSAQPEVEANKQAETPQARSPRTVEKLTSSEHDRDSGVFFANDEHNVDSIPASIVHEPRSPPQHEQIALKHVTSIKSASTPERKDSSARRLRRPAELNLSPSTTQDPSKPKTELEMRFECMRNSKGQPKAALRSPTELLRERLNLSPKKKHHEEIVRVFTPPQATVNGCLMPGPRVQADKFVSTSVRAHTESHGRPSWWCKFDKLVVFDGMDVSEDGELKIHTRTSKGLSIARRRGDMETIIIPLDCTHCQDMLNRHEWKYDMRVCKRSVCWDCRERCKWEVREEHRASEQSGGVVGSRYRADSVLQDDLVREEDLMQKMGIEQYGPRSPIEAVGGIEERLEATVLAV